MLCPLIACIFPYLGDMLGTWRVRNSRWNSFSWRYNWQALWCSRSSPWWHCFEGMTLFTILVLELWVSWLGRNVCPVGQSLAISCQFVHNHELARCAASISKVIEVCFVIDSHSELGDMVRGMQLQQSPKYVHMKSAKADKFNSFLRWQRYPSSLNSKCHSWICYILAYYALWVSSLQPWNLSLSLYGS